MKKRSIAILLTVAMVLTVATAFFALSLTAGAASAPAAPVMNETMTESVVIYDGSTPTTLTDGQSYGNVATFNKGTLTINGLTCSKIETTDGGSLIVDVKGTNTVNNGTANRGILVESSSGKADLTITSSTGGKLTVSAGGYTLMSRRGCILVNGNVDLTVSATANVAVQVGSAGANGAITFAGNSKAKVSSKSLAAIDLPGTDTAFYLKDNADLTVTGSGATTSALGGIKVRGTASSYAEISGNSKLTVSGYSHAIHASGSSSAVINVSGGTQSLNASASALYAEGAAAELKVSGKAALTIGSKSHGINLVTPAGGTALFAISDTATVNAKTPGVAVYLQGRGENKLSWTSSGASSFERTNNNAAIMLERADKATVEIKNGTYTVKGKSGANHNGLFRIDKAITTGSLINMTVENAKLVVDDTAAATTPTTAVRLVGLDGSSVKVLGDSVIDIDVKSSAASNVLTGWDLDNIALTLGGNSVVDINTPGATNTSVGMNCDDVALEGNAKLNIVSSGYGIFTDGVSSSLVASGNSKLTVDGKNFGVYLTNDEGGSSDFILNGTACADIRSTSVALYLHGVGECNSEMNSTGTLNVERTGSTVSGAAFFVNGGENNFTVTSGVVNVTCPSQNIGNAPLNIGASTGSVGTANVIVSGGVLNVTNNNQSASKLINVVMRVGCAEGTVNFSGDATVLLNNNPAGTGDTQIGLLSYTDVSVSDNVIFCAYNNGASAGSSSAAVQLQGANLTVEDKACVDLYSTAGYAIVTAAGSDRVYLNGGITEMYGTNFINNVISLKIPKGASVMSGDTISVISVDRTLNGEENYVKVNVGNLPEDAFINVVLSDGTAKKMRGYPWNTLAAGNGMLTYDPATKTLTMENASGIKQIASYREDLTVNVKGENAIENSGEWALFVDAPGKNLTIQGDGVLNVKVPKIGIVGAKGDVTVTGDVTVNVEAEKGYAFWVSGYSADDKAAEETQNLIFAGNAKVNTVGATNAIIANDAAAGGIIVKDNAYVIATNTEPGSWKGAVDTTSLEMTGGVLEVNVSGSANTATLGIAVSAAKADLEAGAPAGTTKLLGGKLIINVVNDSAVATDDVVADSRGYGLFLKNQKSVEFAGTDVDITVSNKTGTVDAANVKNRAAITWQSDSGVATEITVSKGTIKITSDKNTAGLLGDISGSTFTMEGGSILGKSATLFSVNGGATYTVNGGYINYSAYGSIAGTGAKAKVTAQIQKGAADNKATVLVLGNATTSDLHITLFAVTVTVSVLAAVAVALRKRRSI